MSLENDIRRGERAKAILEDELVQEAFRLLDEATLKGWRDSGAGETQKREQAWYLMRAADAFQDHFKALIEGGILAQHKADQIKRDQAANQSVAS